MTRALCTRAVAICLILILLVPAISLANATDDLCFDQTGQCIRGRIRAYWQENGGLPVFGFPITSAREEINHDTGQTYVTQWFERNRLELHPENTAPYDVLLGRLGDDRLRQQEVNWQALPRDNGPQPGCLWFEQVGFNVCNQGVDLGFRAYWENHGLTDQRLDTYRQSLALFGLPVTSARMETNASGDTVLTQWFERARLEWHPANPDEYKVLLGLLGNEVRAHGGASQPPAAMPRAPAPAIPAPSGACARNAPATSEGVQAWVTEPEPVRNATQTVCVRLIADGQPVVGASATISVRYKSTTSRYGPEQTNTQGVAPISFPIGGATSGYKVLVEVVVSSAGQTHTTQTSFTPR